MVVRKLKNSISWIVLKTEASFDGSIHTDSIDSFDKLKDAEKFVENYRMGGSDIRLSIIRARENN